MVSVEIDGRDTVVTILDDAGQDADFIIRWDDAGESMALIQHCHECEEDSVIILTPLQASYLKDILNSVLIEVEVANDD